MFITEMIPQDISPSVRWIKKNNTMFRKGVNLTHKWRPLCNDFKGFEHISEQISFQNSVWLYTRLIVHHRNIT